MNELEDFLTVNEVAERLKVTPQYVRKLIKVNKLKYFLKKMDF